MFENNIRFCTHPKHETPCPLPCQACEEECCAEIIPCLEININGSISTLYNDDIDLYNLGLVTHVRRASEILFNQECQYWEVVDVKTREIVYQNKIREKCIEWEVINFSPGGKYYNENN